MVLLCQCDRVKPHACKCYRLPTSWARTRIKKTFKYDIFPVYGDWITHDLVVFNTTHILKRIIVLKHTVY